MICVCRELCPQALEKVKSTIQFVEYFDFLLIRNFALSAKFPYSIHTNPVDSGFFKDSISARVNAGRNSLLHALCHA